MARPPQASRSDLLVPLCRPAGALPATGSGGRPFGVPRGAKLSLEEPYALYRPRLSVAGSRSRQTSGGPPKSLNSGEFSYELDCAIKRTAHGIITHVRVCGSPGRATAQGPSGHPSMPTRSPSPKLEYAEVLGCGRRPGQVPAVHPEKGYPTRQMRSKEVPVPLL
jgi:hypothetical protein